MTISSALTVRLNRVSGCGLLHLMLAVGGAAPLMASGQTADWQIGTFQRPSQGNPVITPQAKSIFSDPVKGQTTHWEALHTFNPAAIVRDGRIYVLYRAEDDSGSMEIGGHTSRLGLAVSKDGNHFTRQKTPAFFPDNDDQKTREWPGGVEDPRLVESEDGTYVLTYTQWNRVTYSVGIATSRDLVHWKKWGPAFAEALGGKYSGLKYKSAGIVTSQRDGRLIAAKIKARYWMYWGEGSIHLATSTDLIHWTPVEDADGVPIVVLSRRLGRFDSGFPEVGPPPVVTSRGIVLMINGKNDPEMGDKAMGANAYAAGQALFRADDPSVLLERADTPFLKPELPFEKTGQYAAGTTFAEGLVYFKSKWFLYYGCADSMVAVVIAGEKVR